MDPAQEIGWFRLIYKEEIPKLTQKANVLGVQGIIGQETGTSAAWSKINTSSVLHDVAQARENKVGIVVTRPQQHKKS